MKSILLLSLLTIALSAGAQTSERSIFRKGYQRIGLNFLGGKMDYNLSPAANILNGRYGAKKGYTFEVGKIFYFNKNSTSPFRYGLDWTILSLTYNKMDWSGYTKGSPDGDVLIDGTSLAASIGGRLGPVVSYNPVEKLVIDARFQLAPSYYLFDQSYHKTSQQADEQYFEFADYQREDSEETFNAESIKNRIAFGLKTGFGITVRRQAVGLSFDYIPGKIKINYASDEGGGQRKVKANNLQLKLSFQL